MPRVQEFFSSKLGLPIDFFNPLRNIALSPSASIEELARSAHLLGELVGLALRSSGGCRMSLNLLPAVVARRQEFEKRCPFLIAVAAMILLFLLTWGFYFASASQAIRANVDRVKAIDAPMQLAEAKMDKLLQQAAALDAVSGPVIAAIEKRSFWTQILEDLNARLPQENIWITEFIPTSDGRPLGVNQEAIDETINGLLLRGLYLYNPKQQEVVSDYFRNLAGSSLFDVDIKNQARAIKSTIPTNTEWAFPYELHLNLKKPEKFP